MRESWTDRRLDEFTADTKRRFDEIDGRFDGVDRRLDKVDRRLAKVDRHLGKVDQRLNETDTRLDTMERCMREGFDRVDKDLRELRTQTAAFQRTALQLATGTMVTFVIGFAGLIITRL